MIAVLDHRRHHGIPVNQDPSTWEAIDHLVGALANHPASVHVACPESLTPHPWLVPSAAIEFAPVERDG
jgi:hypothetical protein